MKISIISKVAGCIAVFILLCILLRGEHRDTNKTANMETAVIRPVPTFTVQASPASDIQNFPGKVRANQRVQLAFSVPGLLAKLKAEEGCTLKQGEIIAQLDKRDYQYAFDIASAKFENAKKELSRSTVLWDQKVLTKADFESIETAHDIAQAEYRICQKALQDTILRAPFNGIVVKRHVENHEHVQAKQSIVSFQDISVIEVIFQVSEQLIAYMDTNFQEKPLVRFDVEGEHWHEASIREYSAKSDNITQTYEVVLQLNPPDNLKIFPGMTATVQLRTPKLSQSSKLQKKTTRIPIEALCCSEDRKAYVWLIDPEGGNPKKVWINSAELCGDFVDISSQLSLGQHVAVAGLNMLNESMLVRPMVSGKEGLDG